jgi:hypothetical protein
MPLTLSPAPPESIDTTEAVVEVPLPLPVSEVPNYGGDMLVLAVLVVLVFMLIRAMMTILPYVLSIVIGFALFKYLLS